MRTDRGESLIELVVAIAVMGIAMVALVGGFAASITMSDVHRKQATAGTYVRDYAEAVQNMVAGGGYVACATDAAYATPTGFSVPAGYRASVLRGSTRYWSGGAWQTSCAADTGLQRLTLQVSSVDGRAVEQLTVAVRKPCTLADPLCQ